MRTFTSPLPFMLVVILLASPMFNAYAQTQSLDDKIKQAQEEIGKLDTFIQASTTSDPLKKSLQPILDGRRTKLNALQQLKQVPIPLTAAEISTAIGNLENNQASASPAATPASSPAAIKLAEPQNAAEEKSNARIFEGDPEVHITGTKPNTEIKILRNGAELPGSITSNHKGEAIWNAPSNQPLNAGERVSFKQKEGTGFSAESNYFPVAPSEQKQDTRLGSAVGYLMGGIVLSQQAQEFKQSDPFLGFVGGYRFGGFAKKDKDGKGTGEYHNWGQIQLRFQGIFQSAPRAVSGTTSTTATTTTTPSPVDFAPFIASRKTFDTDLRLWYEFPKFSQNFTAGWYGLWGASTIMSKTELSGDNGQVMTTGTNPQNVSCVFTIASQPPVSSGNISNNTCNLRIDNDLKQYKETGLIMDVSLFNKQLYLKSMLGYGHYEALKGLAPMSKQNTQDRFVGRLHIFPSGLNRDFGGQRTFAPMFGVEINAGYGPDQIKFFIGSIIRIKGLTP